MNGKDAKYIQYFQIVDIWNRLCDEHSVLFDQTCKEYSLLLENNINDLENVVADKNATIKRIGMIEQLRQNVIDSINILLADEKKIGSIRELIAYMEQLDEEKTGKHLFRFNVILIDIIEKIQAQNKRNQLFIIKANETLKDLRNGLSGNNKYCVYTARGSKTTSTRALQEN